MTKKAWIAAAAIAAIAVGGYYALSAPTTSTMDPDTTKVQGHDHAAQPAPVIKDPSLLKLLPADVVKGDANAPVLMIEYASLSCPHCAHFNNKVLPALEQKYIDTGKLKLAFRHFPLNAPALDGAKLANCAPKDKFYAFLKAMFSAQDQWAFTPAYREGLAAIALAGGMDKEQFTKCIEDKAVETATLTARKQGEEGLGVNSTPSFFINGERFTGDQSVDTFSKAIDAALAKK